jgi:8-oxo-dGTP diphosphatase
VAQLYLVRHAKAGERRSWTGLDIERPLSKQGWKQARFLAGRLADQSPTALLSSEYVRCVQTLEPLAERLGVPVQVEHRLTEEEPIEPVLRLLAEADNGTVMCSHGDIIPATIEALKRTGTELRTPVDWRKASVWVLKRSKTGSIVNARVWPPPGR